VERLPLTRAVSFTHPRDGRFVFAFPWEGVILVGTTDVDHPYSLDIEPAINSNEFGYLIEALDHTFPDLELTPEDIQATFSGVRSVIGTGKVDPSRESREHALWREQGLITVAGGKLTTFRIMALSTLRMACAELRGKVHGPNKDLRVLDSVPLEATLETPISRRDRQRLLGRFGVEAGALIEAAPGDLGRLPGTSTLWAELRWAARSEAVCHLEDLLFRRVRLGLLLPQGGVPLASAIRPIVQSELGWDDARWEFEFANYTHLWETYYRPNLDSIV
jgi:glycerol-3-phosphate dehydrogenase